MNINQVVCIHSNLFAEIKTGAMIGEHRPMRLLFFTLAPPPLQENPATRISFTCSSSIPHVIKDLRTRKQPAANCGLGNIAACQHDALSEDRLDVFDLKQRSLTDRCVSSKYRESYKRADVS